ncbi:putative alpha-arabinofuranosidase ii protein [Botrytis cinerea BcDW1]|uniref:Putative alpha-arabinofuranosidase ii protein n=1 Tax=Botryotinia fuckeliana (strain BcDW1) TaxID=1290391 RepID=M7U2T8_BOTF1|nr:putative alpha-arabinofuranosidase ii protein [Botrytis cinerea BcDW1]
MVYISPLSTPTATSETPLRPPTNNTTPWSEISMENWRNGVDFRSPPPAYDEGEQSETPRRLYKANLEQLHKAIWLTVIIVVCFWFWLSQQRQQIHFYQYDTKLSTTEPPLEGLRFIDASHPYIRYVGRWSSTLDGTRKDGSFPGIYLDIAFNGSSTILISLHNKDQQAYVKRTDARNKTATSAFPALLDDKSAEPISLLAQVDDEEYVILPNATSLVVVRTNDLDPHSPHIIRIIAPMIGRDAIETFQFTGVWIDENGQLIPVQNPMSVSTLPFSERNVENGELGISINAVDGGFPENASRRKMLEILTDLPGSMTGLDRRKHQIASNVANGILGGVMGWEYLTGEMFGSDHVTIGMDGMCLLQDCIGGRGSPAGLADVFFQSGPLGSGQYAQPWLFQSYIPDVMILNIGNADWESFRIYNEEYNMTTWELSVLFEKTYVSLIKAIRTLAYPKYSGTMAEVSQYDYPQHRAVDIPIFVMRPFRGQLEQATHSVVDRLQFEGDKSVFWLDTSGWLNTDINFEGRSEDQDFFLDEGSPRKEWRLTERGNQRVAILLHMHVCGYLAQEADKCAFLAPETYQGGNLDPVAIHFDEYMRDEKERRLKKLFWVSPEDEGKLQVK